LNGFYSNKLLSSETATPTWEKDFISGVVALLKEKMLSLPGFLTLDRSHQESVQKVVCDRVPPREISTGVVKLVGHTTTTTVTTN
jgi:hypothetical protein